MGQSESVGVRRITNELLEDYCPQFRTWLPPDFELEELNFPLVGNEALSIINSDVKWEWINTGVVYKIIFRADSEIRIRTRKQLTWTIHDVLDEAIMAIIRNQIIVCNVIKSEQNQYKSGTKSKEEIAVWVRHVDLQCFMLLALSYIKDYVEECQSFHTPMSITSS